MKTNESFSSILENSPIDRISRSGLLKLEAVPEQTLSIQIYVNLREALLSGTLAPGDQLNIRPMATAYGTSSMPVREAMTRLVVDGGLSALPNRAYIVAQVDDKQMREFNLLRFQLEALAAKQAATRQTLKSLYALKEVFEKLTHPATPMEYLANHRAFHFGIYESADMPFLYSTIERIWLRLGPYMNKTFTYADIKEENDLHNSILIALQRGDPSATASAVEEDLRQAAARNTSYSK